MPNGHNGNGFKAGGDHFNFRHGMCTHPAYISWKGMRDRCGNPNTASYGRYGGRGIRVCEAWDKDFLAFWADMGPTWAPGMTIERNDNDLGYDADNCCWVTKSAQAKNRRNSIVVETSRWGRISLADVARRLSMDYSSILDRFNRGLRNDELCAPRANKGPARKR